MMAAAMTEAKRLGKIIAAHCEDNSLLRGGYIHDGAYAGGGQGAGADGLLIRKPRLPQMDVHIYETGKYSEMG